jgi:putative nucleotidyltransferase-like protein
MRSLAVTSRIEAMILHYLSFQLSSSEHHGFLWQANEDQWREALAFADTAGLTLFLRANLKRRGDFQRLLDSIQQGLEQRFQDNVVRTRAVCQELIEFNRLLQAQNIRYLNLKGQVLYPDFVDQRENRLQYDHDFLIDAQDLEKAYALFLNLGYSPLLSSPKLAVGHLPSLVRKTDWKWKGNLFDPAIPRAVELHFQLWDSEFDRIPIRALDDAWRNSGLTAFQSVSVPVLSREQTLLYSVLHSFRHLLRNDLRLAHLYEIGYFLHRRCEDSSFWAGFLKSILTCSNSCRATATMFELARRTFDAEPAPMVRQFLSEHLSPAAAMWIKKYGVQESIHCYRRSKSAVFLHLDFVEGLIEKSVVIGRKFIPRHMPVSSFGVQTPVEQQNRRFHSFKLLHDSSQLVRRALFHAVTLASFLFQLPLWMAKVHLQGKKQRSEPCERYPSIHPSAKA